MRQRKVVQIISRLGAGGAEMRMLELIRSLANEEIHFIIYQTSGTEGHLGEAFRSAGADVRTLRVRNPRFLLDFIRECSLGGAQAIQCGISPGSQFPTVFLPLVKILGVPCRSVRFHSDGLGRTISAGQRIKERIYHKLVDTFATRISGVSPGALTHGWDPDWERDARCAVVVAGLDLDRFTNIPRLRRTDLGLPDDGNILLHVGRGLPVKNRDRAIEIHAQLLRSCPSTHLVFVGQADPDEEGRWRAESERLGSAEWVHFLGYRKDIPSLLRAADVLLLTSLYEGLPGVVFEARAAGLPVVASDLPGTRYLADRLERILLASLDEEDALWAERLKVALQDRRRDDVSILSQSEFDIEIAKLKYLEMWGIPSVTRNADSSAPVAGTLS